MGDKLGSVPPFEFGQILKQGRGVRTETLAGHALPRSDSGPSRFGWVVAAKVGPAVCRNRLKRRLRAIVWMAGEQILPGFDYVIVARSGAGDASYQKLQEDLFVIVNRLGSGGSEGGRRG
ncbi:MAG: ribonuclease P protein component [Candidatus Methylomirabilales bacterium]